MAGSHGHWGFSTPPLVTPFYHGLKALKLKFGLNYRQMLEVLIWLALEFDHPRNWDGGHWRGYISSTEQPFTRLQQLVDVYRDTAPSDTVLPEVVV